MLKNQCSNYTRYLLIFFAVILPYSVSYSQDVTSLNLILTSNKSFDLRNNKSFEHPCKFEVHGIQTIQWLQKNDQVKTPLDVTSTRGAWLNFHETGKITYAVMDGGNKGKITLERNDEGFFLIMDFSEAGEYGIRQRFEINDVEIQN